MNADKMNITKSAGGSKKAFLVLILVFVIPVLVYLQTIRFGFTYFDDNLIILNNNQFLSDFSNVPGAFQRDAFIRETGIFYRPLQTLSYMTDILISGGNNAWMFHLTNILLFGLIACVLYFLLRKLNIHSIAALSGTMIFCVTSAIRFFGCLDTGERRSVAVAFFTAVVTFFDRISGQKKERISFSAWYMLCHCLIL